MRGAPRAARTLTLLVPALGLAAAQDVPQSALKACAAIASDAQRLACYDHLAQGGATAAPPLASAPAAPTPAGALPAAVPAASGAAAVGGSASPPAAPSAGAGAKGATPENFGLYAAEHPAPPATSKSISAKVTQVSGAVVQLEGGQTWELADSDPLLHVGDLVVISRATLGSFILVTPSKRSHRVRRLQ